MAHVDPVVRPRIGRDVDWVAIDGEIVVIDGRDRLHLIDGTGAIIWPLLDGHATVADLADDLSSAFGIERAIVLHDVTSFVSQAVEADLISESDR